MTLRRLTLAATIAAISLAPEAHAGGKVSGSVTFNGEKFDLAHATAYVADTKAGLVVVFSDKPVSDADSRDASRLRDHGDQGHHILAVDHLDSDMPMFHYYGSGLMFPSSCNSNVIKVETTQRDDKKAVGKVSTGEEIKCFSDTIAFEVTFETVVQPKK